MSDKTVSELCRENHIQNCHICEDTGCCDNQNPVPLLKKQLADALALLAWTPADKETPPADEMVLCACQHGQLFFYEVLSCRAETDKDHGVVRERMVWMDSFGDPSDYPVKYWRRIDRPREA